MDLLPLEIRDVKLIRTQRHCDARGFFSEVYNKKLFLDAGLNVDFVQDNHSFSTSAGTVRGLHYQIVPHAQHKLVRVTRGRILDVAVDIRRKSNTFGRHIAVELSSDNWFQLLVPVGFAQGFCKLEPNTEVLYKVSSQFSPEHDAGILWNDPDLGIAWPMPGPKVIVSERDKYWPPLKHAPIHFESV
jgi:dTDP-4-dehydrorhamnose 3,5-epimerase